MSVTGIKTESEPAAARKRGTTRYVKFATAVVVLAAAIFAPIAEYQLQRAEARVSNLSDQVNAWEGNFDELNIRFVRPEGTIPHCNDFAGTGRIPDGWTLLIFDRSATAVDPSYWFKRVAEPTDQGWIARQVNIGEEDADGDLVEISAVLVPAGFGDYVSSIDAGPSGAGTYAYWWSERLPAQPVDAMTLERNGDAAPCK